MMMSRGRRWVKEKKKEIKKKIANAVDDSEKLTIAKSMLGDVYEKYEKFISLIPEVKDKIDTLEKTGDNPRELELWKKALTQLEHVRDRPKAMKIYYAKKVLKTMKKIKELN